MKSAALTLRTFCLLALATNLRAAEGNAALARARDSIQADQIRRHVETLASDAFEGREAGQRGGLAAGRYIMTSLRDLGLEPAGQRGTYYQDFGRGYRNILARVPGNDPELADEFIMVTAHYDHVGYGTRKNSNGPVGYIHNGADDNASGVATLLELAEALHRFYPTGVARTILFVVWDAEEKGLLGSKHWLRQPTIATSAVRLLVNLDMVGRLREDRVQLIGTRSLPGLRLWWSEANVAGALHLEFPWKVLDNSDHYPFLLRRIPVTMVHTGLHDDYHRPSDDPHRLNARGVEQVTELSLNFLVSAAERRSWGEFRRQSVEETADHQARYERLPPAGRRLRLGISWDQTSDGEGVLVRSVWADSPAQRAGIRAGDSITHAAGRPLANGDALRRVVATATDALPLTLRRGSTGEKQVVVASLDGEPRRIGISWRSDDAEPGVLMLSSVAPGSPAAQAGLRRLDRIVRVDGEPIVSGEGFRRTLASGEGPWELLVERHGRFQLIQLELPKLDTHTR